MIETFIKAVPTVTAILAGWLLVQAGWRRVFADERDDSAEPQATEPGWRCLMCQGQTCCRATTNEDSLPAGDSNDRGG